MINKMNPFWITFYSYKGGVGRSLALANVAALLAKKGRKVVLVDFDLEAPGLDSFDEFKCISGKPGVVEYVSEFCNTNHAPKIENFIHRCLVDNITLGELWIMPAGKKDACYNRARSIINWTEMYDSGIGTAFVENWKAAIARHCQPDYVLVDSRTGLTDVGGICTFQLPDLVVMLFGLNEQNIKGISAVAKAIRNTDSGRIPQIHYVATPVPNMPSEKKNLVSERLEIAKKEVGAEIESIIRYSSSAALHERLFTLEDNIYLSPIVEDYKNLLNKLIDYNRNGIDFIEKEVEASISSSDILKMQRLLDVADTTLLANADGCYLSSRLHLALGNRDKAIVLAKKTIRIQPAHEKAYDFLLNHYKRSHAYNDAMRLCMNILKKGNLLSHSRLLQIRGIMGELALAASKPKMAATYYKSTLEERSASSTHPSVMLPLQFNLAEAQRRAKKSPKITVWKKIIDLFEKNGEAVQFSPNVQANFLQAMHIPFALTGDIERAKEGLKKAQTIASRLGVADDVFSVITYSEVPATQFQDDVKVMLAALDRGELWDGTKL
jgi:MinD-like ATPase involved in chromosome partitioning or flagellar assembly